MRKRVGQCGRAVARQEGRAPQGIPRDVVPHRHAPRRTIHPSTPNPATAYMIAMCLAQRVGIVRKLRWGYTLKKDGPGAYRLDMTQARFKNSRFYGEHRIRKHHHHTLPHFT